MAKQISPFINMCQEDQIALLKGGCTELMILRSIISYNPEKNSWSVSINKILDLFYTDFQKTKHCDAKFTIILTNFFTAVFNLVYN